MSSYTNSEKIMDALDLLDTDLAEEVAKLREKKKKRPILWRYGVLAACFALVLLGVLRFLPLSDRLAEGETADGDISIENMGAHNSGTDGLGGYTPTVSENEDPTEENGSKKPETDEGEESYSGETESVPDDEDSFGGGTEGLPGDEPLPALDLRIDGYDGDMVICTVVGNEGCTFYPVGSVVVLRFDIWEGDPVTETTFTRGCVYSVLFNGGHDNSDENTLYAVVAYQLEE